MTSRPNGATASTAVSISPGTPAPSITTSGCPPSSRWQAFRESVRLLVDGKRGPGRFPPPVGVVGDGARVWPWSVVPEWFNKVLGVDLGENGAQLASPGARDGGQGDRRGHDGLAGLRGRDEPLDVGDVRRRDCRMAQPRWRRSVGRVQGDHAPLNGSAERCVQQAARVPGWCAATCPCSTSVTNLARLVSAWRLVPTSREVTN
jgi:hypothetical protein